MNKGIVWAVVMAVAVALLAAGCGGGDETTSLTRKEFVKEANAICKKQEERRSKMILDAGKLIKGDEELPKAARKALVLQTLPPYEEMAAEIDALGAPDGDEQQIDELVMAMETASKKIRSDPLKVIGSAEQYEVANELATEYDLGECTL